MEIVNSLPKKLSILDDIENINNRLGDTDISAIGDGTVTGAIDEVNGNLKNLGWVTNLDTTIDETEYMSVARYSTTATNAPTSKTGIVTTECLEDGVYAQTVKIFSGGLYIRTYSGGVWSDWEEYARKSDIDTVDTKILSNMPTAEYGSGYNIFSVVDDLFVDTARKSASFCYLSAIEGAPNADNGTVTAYSLDIDWITLICVTRFNKVFTANKRGGTWSDWEELARKSDLNAQKELLSVTTSNMSSATANYFDCDWQNYNWLIVSLGNYWNVTDTIIVPVYAYFNTTNSGSRIMIRYALDTNILLEIYQNGNGSIVIYPSATAVAAANLNVRVFGVIGKA